MGSPQLGPYYVVYDQMGNPRLVQIDLTNSNFIEVGMPPDMVRQVQGQQGNIGIAPFSPNDPNVANGLRNLSDLHQQLLANKGAIETGLASDPQDDRRTFVRKPWLDAPPGAISFDPETAVALPAFGGGFSEVVRHTVPEGYDGVITAYSWNFTGTGFTDGSGDIVVQMLRDGIPVRNYQNITVQKGCIQIPRPVAPIRIYSKQVITLVVEQANNVGLTGNVIGSLVGYDYPSRG